MFLLNKYSNVLANRLIILNFSNACSAKIKELDLASGLRQLQFLLFTSPRTFTKLSKWLARIPLIFKHNRNIILRNTIDREGIEPF